jgi:hypothetical protein
MIFLKNEKFIWAAICQQNNLHKRRKYRKDEDREGRGWSGDDLTWRICSLIEHGVCADVKR